VIGQRLLSLFSFRTSELFVKLNSSVDGVCCHGLGRNRRACYRLYVVIAGRGLDDFLNGLSYGLPMNWSRKWLGRFFADALRLSCFRPLWRPLILPSAPIPTVRLRPELKPFVVMPNTAPITLPLPSSALKTFLYYRVFFGYSDSRFFEARASGNAARRASVAAFSVCAAIGSFVTAYTTQSSAAAPLL
jgi:hypothetical protein